MVDEYIIHHDAYLYLHITISIKQDIIIFMVIMQCICENMLICTTYKDTNLAGKLDLNRPKTQIKRSRCICSPHPIPWTRCQEKKAASHDADQSPRHFCPFPIASSPPRGYHSTRRPPLTIDGAFAA
jgi:hypothetical protein